ncbi:unnamed protein product [Mytilus edulis]|uniref:Pleiotrophin/Midkine C-terminal domain-containing protein n=1 Tax=Mytilus edulis TaxID=6550 RepID=A0A8S3VG99_MYTED|nr:unnamed protein product [Mytilus edulis]
MVYWSTGAGLEKCKYETGPWSECDITTDTIKMTMTLKSGEMKECPSTKILTKKCKNVSKLSLRTLTKKCRGRNKIKKIKGECIYDKGSWENCDPVTNKRAKVKSLKSANGQDRCFFGVWGDWSDCQNGVQKKQRQVVQGGVDCQKRAVKTRPCS